MRPNEAVELSAAGAHRRELILSEMRRTQRWRIRKRVALRSAAAVAVPSLALMVVATHGGARGPVPNPSAGPSAGGGSGKRTVIPGIEHPARFAMQHASFQMVPSDATLVERWAAHGDVRRIAIINDDELLDELRQIGRPTGLIRTAGRVELTAQVAWAPAMSGNGG